MQLIAIFIFNAIIIVCGAEKESEGKKQRRGRRGKEEQNGWSTKKMCSSCRRQGQREERGGKKKSFDEGWCCSGWVHDNSWAEDFPPLSIIFNGLRDRQVTETNPDGSGKKITRVWQWWVYEEGSLRRQWRLLNATRHKSGSCAAIAKTTSSTIISRTYLHRNCYSTFPDTQNCSIWASRQGRSLRREKLLLRDRNLVLFLRFVTTVNFFSAQIIVIVLATETGQFAFSPF